MTVNGLSGALTLAAGSGITITPSGNTLTIAASGGSGANTALSNLATTAINADLIFAVDGVIRTQNKTGVTDGLSLTLQPGTVDSGAVGQLNLLGSTDAGEINIQSAGAGRITIQAGQAEGISLIDGSQGTAGYVWTSTDTAGQGTWLPASGGSSATRAATNPDTLVASVDRSLFVNTSVGVDTFVVNLPAGVNGTEFYIKDAGNNAATNPITFVPNGGDLVNTGADIGQNNQVSHLQFFNGTWWLMNRRT